MELKCYFLPLDTLRQGNNLVTDMQAHSAQFNSLCNSTS